MDSGTGIGHINLIGSRLSVGVGHAYREGNYGLIGAELRGPGSRLRVSDSFALREGQQPEQRTYFDAGLEVGTFPVIYYVIGRALRDALHSRRPLAHADRPLDPTAATWLDRGRDELEAVAAFLNLAQELAALGAPPSLVARCLEAADDEARHALICLGRAADHGGARIRATPLPIAPRRPTARSSALSRLAHESWHDGYVNETRNAQELLGLASQARDDTEARSLVRIGVEEVTHAALGLDIAPWCAAA